MPPPFFEIDELLRLVIDELVETSRRSAVSFALTCRSFEEPALSSLWKKQTSFVYLLMVMRGFTYLRNKPSYAIAVSFRDFPVCRIYQFPQEIGRNHSMAEWARFRRYASWMRGLDISLYGTPSTDTLSRISCNASRGPLFPELEWLKWDVHAADTVFPFFDLFLSPRLQRVTLYAEPQLSNIPQDQVAALTRIISVLTTSLEDLFVECGQEKEGPLEYAMSSFVCRCGPLLRGFGTCIPLSEAAIHHLMQLPNLSHWGTSQGPPRDFSTHIFPPLAKLRLYQVEALPWLHLLASHGKGNLPKGSASATSHTNIGGTLKFLDCPENTIIDSTFSSSIVKFRSLVTLHVRSFYCSDEVGCAFRITDDGVKDLVTALPHLEDLLLGKPCGMNTCNTTVASLVSISTHCLDLKNLETHFNTRRIVGDMQRLLDGGAEHDGAKCKLRGFSVAMTPLEVGEEDIQTIAMGLNAIFPDLMDLDGYSSSWCRVRLKMVDLQGYC